MSDFPLPALFNLLNDVDKLINIVKCLKISVDAGIMSIQSEASLFDMLINKFIREVQQPYTVTLLKIHKEEFIKFIRMKVTMETSSSQHEQRNEQRVTLTATETLLFPANDNSQHFSTQVSTLPNNVDSYLTTIEHCNEQNNIPISLHDKNEDIIYTATDNSQRPVSEGNVSLPLLQTAIAKDDRKKAPVYLYDTEIFKYKTLCPFLDFQKAALLFNNKFVCSFDPLKKLESNNRLRNNVDNETCIFRCSCGNGNFSLQFRHYKNCNENECYVFQVFVKNKAQQDVLLHFNTSSANYSFGYGIINNDTSVEQLQIEDELLDCKPPAKPDTELLVHIPADTGISTDSTDTTSNERSEVFINSSPTPQNEPPVNNISEIVSISNSQTISSALDGPIPRKKPKITVNSNTVCTSDQSEHFTESTIETTITEELVYINTANSNCTDSANNKEADENEMNSHNSSGSPVPHGLPQMNDNTNSPCNSNRPTTPTIIVTAMLQNSNTTNIESQNFATNMITPAKPELTINSTTQEESISVPTHSSAAEFRTSVGNSQHSRLTVTVNLVNDVYEETSNSGFHNNFKPPLPRFFQNNVSSNNIRLHVDWYRDNIMYPFDYLQRKCGFYTLEHLPELFDSYSDEFYDNEANEYCVACQARNIGRNQIAAYNETCVGHWMCLKCTYIFMYNMPKLDEYLTVNQLKKVQNVCPGCRQPPKWRKTIYTMNSQVERVMGEHFPDGYQVFGIHQNVDTHIPYCNYITKQDLFSALQQKSGVIDLDSSSTTRMTAHQTRIYKLYISLNNKLFRCSQCRSYFQNIHCCMIELCPVTCSYKLCLQCLATRIVRNNPDGNNSSYYSGSLTCMKCKNYGAAWNPYSKVYVCKNFFLKGYNTQF
jgi:hypothetical protein